VAVGSIGRNLRHLVLLLEDLQAIRVGFVMMVRSAGERGH
jgi:hypothetical protein